MGRPSKVRPGDPITAEWANAIAQYIAEGGGITAGPGLLLTRSSTGTILALAGAMGKYAVPARITRVYGVDGSFVQDVRYDATPFKEADTAKLVYVTPTYGRPVASGLAIKPAKLGALCAILRAPGPDGNPVPELLLLSGTEQYKIVLCTRPGALRQGPPVIGPDGLPMDTSTSGPPTTTPPDPGDGGPVSPINPNPPSADPGGGIGIQ